MIDTQAIRSKILDLAMRGQLTEQLPEDGTAEELYQQIQAEKQRLIKEGKIKKDKPLYEINEEKVPFEIPNSWKWVVFGKTITLQSGQDLKSEDYNSNENGIPYLTGASNFDDNNKLIINRWTNHPKNIAVNGDLLLSCKGTVGKIAILEEERVHIARQFMAIRTYELNVNYVAFFMLSVIEGIKKASKGLIPGIERNDVLNLSMPLPPFVEQNRIVEKIEQAFSVLDTIDELQAQYADNLTALKSKLIDAAIQGKLTEQLPEDGTAEELYQQIQAEKQRQISEGKIKKQKPLPEITNAEISFDIPDNWKWVRLGGIASIFGGKRIPAGRSLTQEDTGHKYIRVSEMKNGTVITDNLLFVPEDIYPSISRYIINKQDVYITVAGTIGRVGKIPPEIDGANLTENADRIVFSNLDQDWLIICLSSSEIQKQIERLTTSVAQPKLAIKRIQEFRIPLPPLAEQKRIVQKLNEILPLCEKK